MTKITVYVIRGGFEAVYGVKVDGKEDPQNPYYSLQGIIDKYGLKRYRLDLYRKLTGSRETKPVTVKV